MKRLKAGLRWAFSFVLIVFLFYTVDVQEILSTLNRSKPIFLLIAYLIALGDRFIMALKWLVLLRARGVHIPLLNLTGTYVVTTFLGLFLPATVGADALRAYAVTRDGYKGSVIVSSIIVERVIGFLALFIFMLISMVLSVFVFGSHFFDGIWQVFWLAFGLLVALSVVIFVSLNEGVVKRIGDRISRLRLAGVDLRAHKLTSAFKDGYRSYLAYQDRTPQLAIFFVLSLVENLFPLFWTYSLSIAFGVDVPLLYFFILVPLVLVLVRLPISLDGFGLQEGAFVYFLALIGVARPEALLLGLSSHILAILSVLPGGILYALGGLTIHVNRELKPEQTGLSVDQISSSIVKDGDQLIGATKVGIRDSAAQEAKG